MKPIYSFLICLTLALALTACVTQPNPAQTPHGKLVQDAEKFVSDLHQEGKLPGIGSAEHARIIAAAPWNEGEVSYPAKVLVRAWRITDNGTTAFTYNLVKDSADAPWRMTSAQRLSVTGKPVENLMPK